MAKGEPLDWSTSKHSKVNVKKTKEFFGY